MYIKKTTQAHVPTIMMMMAMATTHFTAPNKHTSNVTFNKEALLTAKLSELVHPVVVFLQLFVVCHHERKKKQIKCVMCIL